MNNSFNKSVYFKLIHIYSLSLAVSPSDSASPSFHQLKCQVFPARRRETAFRFPIKCDLKATRRDTCRRSDIFFQDKIRVVTIEVLKVPAHHPPSAMTHTRVRPRPPPLFYSLLLELRGKEPLKGPPSRELVLDNRNKTPLTPRPRLERQTMSPQPRPTNGFLHGLYRQISPPPFRYGRGRPKSTHK